MRAKYILPYKFVQWIIIPFGLFMFGYILSLFLNPSATFSVLVHSYGRDSFLHFKSSELLKGQMVDAAFTQKEDNLGIVAVRFNTYIRINDDFLIFRIKELASSKWYYENKYKVDQFQPDKLFTFGFPVITNSGGRKYYFQIISTKGTKDDSVAISTIEPVFVTKSQVAKNEITKNPKKFLAYLLMKASNFFENKLYFAFSFTYFFPLVLYIFWQLLRHVEWQYKKYFFIFGILSIYFSFFIMLDESTFLTIEFLIMWYLIVKYLTFASDMTMSMALMFFVSAPIFESISMQHVAESSMYWFVLLLIFAGGQMFYEYYKKPKKLIRYNQFLQK